MCNHPNGAPAQLLAREVGLRLGTAYHLLRTLVFEGYVVRLPDGSYAISDRVASLLSQCRVQVALTRIRPALAALRDEGRAACLDLDGEPRRPAPVWLGGPPRPPTR